MYLKRVTIAGFKSFAGKVVLELEPGITAVVGPNGSGKSNLADAVRWALGEQSKGRLRLGDREEVVFAGTDKRPRASFAEVTLLFDNQDGAFPLDLTEVEICRRLYRSGETDYRLGGRSVRLGDIQQLLAEAGFGTNTYAVIGQGMIDNFLLSSPSERKLLFDEAAGIRGSELKREAALRKLTATAENLTRLRDIQAELAPRLASLERAMAAVAEERVLDERIKTMRQTLVAARTLELTARQAELGRERSEVTLDLHRLRHESKALEREQAARLRAAAQAQVARAEQQAAVRTAEAAYEAQMAALAKQQAALAPKEQAADRLADLRRREARLKIELAAAERAVNETVEELVHHQSAAEQTAHAVERTAAEVAKAQARLLEIRGEIGDGTQQQYISHALALLKTLAQHLTAEPVAMEQIRLLVHKTGRLLSHATKADEAEFLERIQGAQVQLEAAMAHRETVAEHQTNITITQRSLEIDLAHRRAAAERIQTELGRVAQEHERLATAKADLSADRKAIAAAEAGLTRLKAELSHLRSAAADQPSEPAAANVADAATRLERLHNLRAAAEARLAATAQELAAIAAARRQLHDQALAWGIKPATVVPAPGTSAPAELERELTHLEAELAARQSLQAATTVEYDEVSIRASDLAAQITDLEQAETDLRQIVEQLNGLIQDRFRDNFSALAERFSQYFTRLFGGGTASLELIEQDDGNYGIIIKASPKGKRLTNLSALSGGERAMAGVALLAAILNVNPSPFVVLDEIDAALDEANSGRLSDILGELADRSQLIVITHNRQTMRAARVLFGVTMNEHHVSHLLSLRLEEASALAAR